MLEFENPEIANLATQELFDFACNAQSHYGTSDLVVFLDNSSDQPEIYAVPRLEMIASDKVSVTVKTKLSKPASDVDKQLSSPRTSFWLIVQHDEERTDCVAVNASMLAPGGFA